MYFGTCIGLARTVYIYTHRMTVYLVISRVGQNRVIIRFWPTLVNSLPKILYIQHVYTVLAKHVLYKHIYCSILFYICIYVLYMHLV